MTKQTQHILEYLTKIKSANKEAIKKEIFKDLLNRLYQESQEIIKLVDKITLGAEKTVLNIKLEDRSKQGRADSYFNNVIIEFENNLKTTENHAMEQLAEYLSGAFRSGDGYNFTLIASDFIDWRIYAPSLKSIDGLGTIDAHEIELVEIPGTRFTVTDKNTEDFYYWLDRFLFKETKQAATLERIQIDFGEWSQTFIESIQVLSSHFNDAKKFGEVKVAYEQWKRFLSIAYGEFHDSEQKYLVHTYLSIFSKMLAYSVLANKEYIDDDDIHDIMRGSIFERLNVKNLIDHDFYYWVANDTSFKHLKKVFRKIAQQISFYDFDNVSEDVLKGVYQDLIDIDTRHALGEYYTPDWLCERVVQEFDFSEKDKILDPACGSGSFLRATVDSLRAKYPKREVSTLNEQIFGIDIHPLSVQIAKTTLLIAFGPGVRKLRKPISINVFLANTVLLPAESANMFGAEVKLNIDKKKLVIDANLFENARLFDDGLEVCEELSEFSQNKAKEKEDTLHKALVKRSGIEKISKSVVSDFYKIYEGFKEAKDQKRNGIWKFIVQNSYRPYFLKKQFDYIVGNPPWFTYSDIKNEEYQNDLKKLAIRYNVMPKRVANFPHLEIAAIFLAHASSYFLKEKGKLAFVLPRSFMSADQHNETRSGHARGFKITSIWDLDGVDNLFNIPSCVLFAEQRYADTIPSEKGISGLSWKGKLKRHNQNWQEASASVKETKIKWYYSQLGDSTAYTSFVMQNNKGASYYKKRFKQGATIVPRNFYFVQLEQPRPDDFIDRTLTIRTNQEAKKEAKKPWNEIDFEGKIESKFLFYTAIAKNILPFTLLEPELVTLPIELTNDKAIQMRTWQELKNEGYLDAANWFRNVENTWSSLSTEKNQAISSESYLNWNQKLTEQNLNSKYLVLYTASAKDANTALLERSEYDLEFIVESKAYCFETDDLREANFLVACLNSNEANELIKSFQTRGLFGARDVHKRILDVPFPKFDSKDKRHQKLTELGERCSQKAKAYAKTFSGDISGLRLGKARLDIKVHLKEELEEIDVIVKELIF